MYDNILKAMNGGGLTAAQKADNYNTFSKLMEENIYLPDLLRKVDALEKRLDTIGGQDTDADLFAVMESAVRDDGDVMKAHERLMNERTRVLSKICMSDESYKKASEEYRRTVNAAFIKYKNDPGKGEEV